MAPVNPGTKENLRMR